MAIKKSELYSKLWKSCDELRGSMDPSQYKDYVLALLFMKYVSDKKDKLITIPPGGSFYDMVELKGKDKIGENMNTIIGAFAKANDLGDIFAADFDDDDKVGKGKAKIERLSNLIDIFNDEDLDFSKNRAEGDDLLGDAYEYLMRNFATESGKSKGQFYTPAEVSRIMAKVIGIDKSTKKSATVYDPTCGSGSLLLKVAAETPNGITIYGQEMDNATRGLAVMNMWLHGNPQSVIVQGNTLSDPEFKDDVTGELQTFDFVVANPKFSDKSWTNGLNPKNDPYKRFDGYDKIYPPKKNGDYAYLLHILKSMKSKGKGAVVLPLGVLSRGNAEASIRKKIVDRGYIKGIIGLPQNLFFGTGISACILVLDKEHAEKQLSVPVEERGIFIIDASKGFKKEGNKNRLREQDLHKIVDVFNSQTPVDKFSRFVPITEIANPKNDYNLNLSRYIDTQEEEDIQDIEAHLLGDIPTHDIDNLNKYWEVYPSLKNILFTTSKRKNYSAFCIKKDQVKSTIYDHPEFIKFTKEMDAIFEGWHKTTSAYLNSLEQGLHPKQVIYNISESLLKTYDGKKLIDKYAMYQHLMNYWSDVMQDDMYEIAVTGWEAGKLYKRLMKKAKKENSEDGKEKEKAKPKPIPGIEGIEGVLIPVTLLIQEYFSDKQQNIDKLQADLETAVDKMTVMEEEHLGEGGLLTEVNGAKGISKKAIQERVMIIRSEILDSTDIPKEYKELAKAIKKDFLQVKWTKGIKDEEDLFAELDVLYDYLTLIEQEAKLKENVKKAKAELEIAVLKKYPLLYVDEIKNVVIEKKWMTTIQKKIEKEVENVSHYLTIRITELAERYETPLPLLNKKVEDLRLKVEGHLKKMNFTW